MTTIIFTIIKKADANSSKLQENHIIVSSNTNQHDFVNTQSREFSNQHSSEILIGVIANCLPSHNA